MIATAEKLMTAEEFGELDDGLSTELVRGRVILMNMPYPRHGQICANVVRIVGQFIYDGDLGQIASNDSGVITERGPDTVRGADVAYYSFDRLPRGPMPRGYLAVSPDLIFEIRSPSDRWPKVLAKVAEYLNADVKVVCVLDEQTQAAHVFAVDDPVRVVAATEDLTLPEIFPTFRVPVRRFFE
jgi:Uma2 family endonuclease